MKRELTLETAISTFGESVRKKLTSVGATGEPEEQLRTPLDILIREIVELLGLPRASVDVIGETKISELKTRPDFAVLRAKLLVGFIEVKAPGKGADPRRFKDPHDKAQWDKLKSLPNLIYTDGNAFSLWHDGELVALIQCEGEIESAAKALRPPRRSSNSSTTSSSGNPSRQAPPNNWPPNPPACAASCGTRWPSISQRAVLRSRPWPPLGARCCSRMRRMKSSPTGMPRP